ncbi:MAG: AFG1 family ATPase [Rhodobacteraceae bacterium]|nr:AFG1 family ATPase [Paracoccaceae bacterium]
MNLPGAYRQRVADGLLKEDPAQFEALEILEDLCSRSQAGENRLGGLGRLLGRRSNEPGGGLYLWGGVGRGKSMLMDLFYEHLPVRRKKRTHFLEFMQSVHTDLHRIRKREVTDAILPAADAIANKASHLCLDEMQIDDIADAMIVGRLFKRLFERNVTVVTTSNRPPDELYRHGLNRHLFFPFIKLISNRMTVHEIGGGDDHRRGRLADRQTYFVPADRAAQKGIDGIWDQLTQGRMGSLVLTVKSRRVELQSFANGAARVDFSNICGMPYGPADYLAIAGAVRVLVVENVPLMCRANHNEAKRFVMLIDALYDSGVMVVMSAAAVPEELHQGGGGAFEFERTSSRLAEMQSSEWGAVLE